MPTPPVGIGGVTEGEPVYFCTMHPDQTSDKEGKCEIEGCGMDLVKGVYYCADHPGLYNDSPGTCPTCGATLELVTSEKAQEAQEKFKAEGGGKAGDTTDSE